VDTTAQPFFAHAPDYSWLQGRVEYSHLSKAWRLRYASVDSEDVYGGSVTLAENDLLKNLKEGECIRAEGHISTGSEITPAANLPLPTQRQNIAPPYVIGTFSVIKE
jgi:hypothetical protein